MTLLEALVNQGHDVADAQELIRDMKRAVAEGEDPEELLHAEGLEPDYVMDLLW
jgi:hypothetical protein